MMRIKLLFMLIFLLSCAISQAQDLEHISEVKPVEFSGTFTVFGSYYNVNGIEPRRKDFSWYATGNPLLKLYGVEIPFSFTVSEQERSFRQPFNQFCISPTYKWAKAHLGYTNLTWSPFTWSGQTALGAAVELNPGKLRFGLLYGRLNRAVEEDLTSPEVQTPSFKRMGYAFRMGYGTETSHVDLIMLKGKDDENSLNTIPQGTEVLPGENVVAGISSKYKLTQKLFWDADVATSVFTRDVRALPLSGDDASTVNSFNSLIIVNSSTQMYNAYQTEVRYEEKKYKIKAKYRRVDPDFQSMGAYYFQTDVENITLEPSAYLLKNKLKITSSLGRQRDNLMNKKSFTTKRFIGNIGLDYTLSSIFGFNAMYGNYSGEQGKGLKIPNQTTQQSFVSQNMVLMPRLTFVKEKLTHFHSLMVNRQWLTDKNPNTAGITEYKVDNLNYNSSFVFNKIGLTLGASYLLSIFESNLNTTRLNGIGINTSRPFLKNKLISSLSVNGTQQKINHENFADIVNLTFQNTYKLNEHHGLTLLGIYIDNKAKTPTGISFSEYNIDLGYTYTF
ncbi:hypothetical protein [Flavobacterium sp. GT3R68]|uniref:hypothetical protein n=1 Tax=Flavobacterium sp. GT3R68 TaxID=2594437 RepID=UPI000F88B3DD|nr:hypothetical protein [Flavobacterium sp. GT3R68]RTY91380.1 hypothetical protein EKL32_19320 [Flavobacterium sp. GSN2]TRW94006.1 hypothetical protein FNW07_03585 [Flavobacterium sp. GT3R68]